MIGLPISAYAIGASDAGTSLVYSDMAGAYSIAAFVSADLAGSYAIEGGTTLVSADLAGAFSVAALVGSNLAATFTTAVLVRADLLANFAIESNNGEQMSFTPSVARTVTVNPGSKPFTAGELWNLSEPKKPRSPKDSDSTVDYSFNWAPWLADVSDTIASHEILVTDGLVSEGSSSSGTLVTVFVSAGTPAKRASITCRIMTASTPPRSEDRTIFLDMEAA